MKSNSNYEETSNKLYKEIDSMLSASKNLHEMVDYLSEIFISDRDDAVSSVGIGKMNKENFMDFLEDEHKLWSQSPGELKL